MRPPFTFLSILMCSSAACAGVTVAASRQTGPLQQLPHPRDIRVTQVTAFPRHGGRHQQAGAHRLAVQPLP